MPEIIIAILLFVAITAVAALVFVGWVCAKVVAVTWRALTWPMRGRSRTERVRPGPAVAQCRGVGCVAVNPADARFCRRCGRELRQQHVVSARPTCAAWRCGPGGRRAAGGVVGRGTVAGGEPRRVGVVRRRDVGVVRS